MYSNLCIKCIARNVGVGNLQYFQLTIVYIILMSPWHKFISLAQMPKFLAIAMCVCIVCTLAVSKQCAVVLPDNTWAMHARRKY